MKRCNNCGVLKPLSEYYGKKDMKDGYYNFCKKCAVEKALKWRDNLRKNDHEKYIEQIRKRKLSPNALKFQKEYNKKKWKDVDKRRKYNLVHKWARKNIPDEGICEICNEFNDHLNRANISGQYLRVQEDWIVLCNSCHQVFDNTRSKGGENDE